MKLGVITIGQSPRTDMIPEMAGFWPGVEVLESGALDGLTLEKVREFAPGPGDYVLVTRMQDGAEVTVAKKHILPRMQGSIDSLAGSGCQAILFLCTGEFPGFRSPVPLIRPQPILHGVVGALSRGLHLGAMLPSPDQIPHARRRWGEIAARVTVVSATPYVEGEAVASAAAELRRAGADLVVMDCMGYTRAMRANVRQVTGVPVLLARNVIARVVGEVVG